MTRTQLFKLFSTCLVVLFIVVACERLSQTPTQSSSPPQQELNVPGDTSTGDDSNRKGEVVPTATAAWWWTINVNIWSRAIKDVGKYTGLQCKEWASNVVRDATGFPLPSTQSNWIYFNSGHVIRIVDGNTVGGGTIESGIGFGNIIQMHIKYKRSDGTLVSQPHTAIFYEYVPGGMNWIDCNFVAAGTVGVHFVSWEKFRAQVGTRYSIYQATN